MEPYYKNLGRTAFCCKDEHNKSEEYRIGSIVYKIINGIINSFISTKDVPQNIDCTNEEYWQPISLTIEYI